MNSRAALGAAAAVALTVTGGVSALFLTIGQAADASQPSANQPAVIEYVDQYGNPVAAPGGAVAPTPEVIFVNPDGTPVNLATMQAGGGYQANDAGNSEAQYSEDEYGEDEYEEDEDEEDGNEYEDESEYEDGPEDEPDHDEGDDHDHGPDYEEGSEHAAGYEHG